MQRVIDSGLSSGEDSDEDETAPEGFEEEIKNQTGWVDLEQATFPPISLSNIHSYFVQRRIKREQVTATKPFEKGFRIHAAHKVKSISIKAVLSSNYTIIRATVLPSQRNDRTYQVYIAANTTTGFILHATCTCIAGKCGACNHTAAVMFSMDEASRVQSETGNSAHPSCTSLPAKWPIPSRAPHAPQTVQDMQVVKPKYDTTPTSPKKCCSPVPVSVGLVTTDRVKQLKHNLKNSYDGELLFHQVWPENIDISQEQQLQEQVNTWKD